MCATVNALLAEGWEPVREFELGNEHYVLLKKCGT